MKFQPLQLIPRDCENDPPDVLQDVFVFGRLDLDSPADWHMGYMTDEEDRAPVWYVVDSGEPGVEILRPICWAEIPGDPRPPLSAVA